MRVLDRWAKAGQGVGARRGVPHAHPLIVARRDEVPAVVGPDDAVDSTAVRTPLLPIARAAAQSVEADRADRVFFVEQAEAAGAAPDVPEADGAVCAAAGDDMLGGGAPGGGQDGSAVAGERVRRGSGTEIDEADGGLLGGTGHKEMGSYGGHGVRVDDMVEIKGRGNLEGLGGVYFECVVVGRGEKSE